MANVMDRAAHAIERMADALERRAQAAVDLVQLERQRQVALQKVLDHATAYLEGLRAEREQRGPFDS